MPTTMHRIKISACVFVAVTALAGCGRHQAAESVTTPAQKQQADQQSRAYYESHYGAPSRNGQAPSTPQHQ